MHWKKDDMVYKLGSSLLHICLCTFKHLMKYNNRLLFECCLSLFFTFSLICFTTLSQYYLIVWPFLPSPVFSDFCCHTGLSAFSTPPFFINYFSELNWLYSVEVSRLECCVSCDVMSPGCACWAETVKNVGKTVNLSKGCFLPELYCIISWCFIICANFQN